MAVELVDDSSQDVALRLNVPGGNQDHANIAYELRRGLHSGGHIVAESRRRTKAAVPDCAAWGAEGLARWPSPHRRARTGIADLPGSSCANSG